jgi:deazaflavin-dependent oxidoreductase (nitroreductase family)
VPEPLLSRNTRGAPLITAIRDMAATKEAIEAALERGHTIDITTTGRRTGDPRRLEIVFHNVGGRIYISGTPYSKKRRWLLNLEADPHLTFHLKGRTRADLPATARIIDEEEERRTILPHIARAWGRKDLERMVRYSPLIEVTLDSWPAGGSNR